VTSESDIDHEPRGAAIEAGPDHLREAAAVEALLVVLGRRVIALVGMMGSGKTSIGKRLATKLGLSFVDSDAEIEAAAGMTIMEIFDRHGEPYFRDGERRVIARLLGEGPCVLATGGGAFMDARTREAIATSGVSVWLRADKATLTQRIARRNNRPLMRTADPATQVERLLAAREPIYAQADIIVDSSDRPHGEVIGALIRSLLAHFACHSSARAAP
jgi:shikimate kinase